MRVDDEATQEVVQLSVKSTKLSAEVVTDVLKWFLKSKDDDSQFKSKSGKVDMETLHKEAGSVKFLPHEMDKKEVEMISKEFKKYDVMFAVDKVNDGKFVLAFAAKNEQSIEHAMKQVIKKQDLDIRKQKVDERKNTINKVKQKSQDRTPDNEGKTKEKEHEKHRSRQDVGR